MNKFIVKITRHELNLIMSEAYLNTLDNLNKKKMTFKECEKIVEFILFNYIYIDVIDEEG
jgi:hypothetical protein